MLPLVQWTALSFRRCRCCLAPQPYTCLAAANNRLLPRSCSQLLTFVNAFLLLNDANRLAVFTADAAGARLAYCSPACLPPGAAGAGDAAEATAWPPSVAVLAGLQQAATAAAGAGAGAPAATGGSCQLSAALSRALCFIQSQRRRAAAAAAGPGGGAAGGGDGATAGGAVDEMGGQGSQAARVLCLSGGTDVPSQYIAVMNAIFSAQVVGGQQGGRAGMQLQGGMRVRRAQQISGVGASPPAGMQSKQVACSASLLCLRARSNPRVVPDLPPAPRLQRSGILIDACQLGLGHSAFLQQAHCVCCHTALSQADVASVLDLQLLLPALTGVPGLTC